MYHNVQSKRFFLNQTIYSSSSICSFLGLIAHIQLLIEPKKLISLSYYFLDEVYMLILYFKSLATTMVFAISHVTLFGCRPGGEVQHCHWTTKCQMTDGPSDSICVVQSSCKQCLGAWAQLTSVLFTIFNPRGGTEGTGYKLLHLEYRK